MSETIYEKLKQLKQSNDYPFHMPGHKRRNQDIFLEESLYEMDITEITGFDRLDRAESLLKDSMKRAAAIYGSQKSYYLVNGSTGGILAAFASVCQRGDRVLMSRNAHKSAYHAVELLGLRPVYLYPEMKHNICTKVTGQQVKEALAQNGNEIKAVFIVSPTYEGMVSDVQEIAKQAHIRKIPLIVDEAHGAHFNFGSQFPVSSVQLGADLVVQSLHKTLPSPTQTAILHLCGSLVLPEKVEYELSVFQTSSPSYIFLAAIEYCILFCDKNRAIFEEYARMLFKVRNVLEQMNYLQLIRTDDPGKIVISTQNSNVNGLALFRLLRDNYHLEFEMADVDHVIAMTSICDTWEGLQRMADALMEIDRNLSAENKEKVIKKMSPLPVKMSPYECKNYGKCWISPEKAEGKVCGTMIHLYPPGIPIIVPGEVYTNQTIETIQAYIDHHMQADGVQKDQVAVLEERE